MFIKNIYRTNYIFNKWIDNFLKAFFRQRKRKLRFRSGVFLSLPEICIIRFCSCQCHQAGPGKAELPGNRKPAGKLSKVLTSKAWVVLTHAGARLQRDAGNSTRRYRLKEPHWRIVVPSLDARGSESEEQACTVAPPLGEESKQNKRQRLDSLNLSSFELGRKKKTALQF